MPITRRRRANPPDQPDNTTHVAEQPESAAEPLTAESGAPEASPIVEPAAAPVDPSPVVPAREPASYQPNASLLPPFVPGNGERGEPKQEYTPPIEGGRRTARGELFRRPPQPPQPVVIPSVAPPVLQAPSHEINFPLGNLLHLAYNPGYTGSDEARSVLLRKLAAESKAGGRARCWNCGSLAIVYDLWNTRSKNFGEVGVAFCEICGVWSVM